MSRALESLGALFVNHHSGAYLRRAVASLLAEWKRDGRAAVDLEVVVVDCASGPTEEPHLRQVEALGARVARSPRNLGYAGGMNLAFGLLSERRGARAHVALLNPDIEFLPGSIAPLLRALEDPGVGVVGPRTWFTSTRDFLMPTLELPSFGRQMADVAARASVPMARRLADERSRARRRLWEAVGSVDVEMLSGACLVLRRDRVESLGEPLDGSFPLYFEDADLCRRLGAAGLGVRLVPESEIAHCGARSSGQGAGFRGEAARRWARSRARYLGLEVGPDAVSELEAFEAWVNRRPVGERDRCPHEVLDLGSLGDRGPRFEWGDPGRVLLEVALGPTFGLAAGRFVEGGSYTLERSTLESLHPGSYLVRAVDPTDGRVLGCWGFEKLAEAVPPGPEAARSTVYPPRASVGTRPPRALDQPPRGRVLCLAPHPDDEVLGCGGTLRKHVDQGDEVHVIVAFDGAAGLEVGADVGIRRREALLGGSHLGLDRYVFWNHPEGHPPEGPRFERAVEALVAWIDEHRPRWIYAPWIGEQHPDHRTVAVALDRALERLRGRFEGEALGFEVWTPLVPDRVVDISDVIEHKRAALAEHRSQSRIRDLAHCGLGINAQRSSFLVEGARFGEAFMAWDGMPELLGSESSRPRRVADGEIAA